MVIIRLIRFIRVLSSDNRWLKGEELSTNGQKMLQKQSQAKSRRFSSPSVVSTNESARKTISSRLSTNPWIHKFSALFSVHLQSCCRSKSPVMSVKCLAESHPLKGEATHGCCPDNDPSLEPGRDKNTQNHSMIDSPVGSTEDNTASCK